MTGMTRAMRPIVIELLMSDPVILFFSAAGLVVTTVSIVRDTRTQRAQSLAQKIVAQEFVAAEEYAEAA